MEVIAREEYSYEVIDKTFCNRSVEIGSTVRCAIIDDTTAFPIEMYNGDSFNDTTFRRTFNLDPIDRPAKDMSIVEHITVEVLKSLIIGTMRTNPSLRSDNLTNPTQLLDTAMKISKETSKRLRHGK